MSDDSEFTEKQLARIRAKFFEKMPDKKFYQEKNRLMEAIAFPAVHLQERYGNHVNTPEPLSEKILDTVIEAIATRGMNRRKIEQFSIYFLHCVQTHMQHHGEKYYEEAKTALRIAESLPAVLSKLRIGEAQRSTYILVGLHRALKNRGGRKKKQPANSQLPLNLIYGWDVVPHGRTL